MTPVKRLTASLVAMLLLSGCAARLGPIVDTATVEGQTAADAAARGNLALVCATTVGAYFRLENPQHQEGIQLICSTGGIALPEPE